MATLRDKLFISDNRSHLLQIKKLSPCKTFAKQAGLNADKAKYHLDDVEPTGKRGYGSPEQFYAEICRQPSVQELRYHAEAEEMRWFLIRQNMRKCIHYRWNIFFHSDFSRMYPGRHYNACVGQKFLYIKE